MFKGKIRVTAALMLSAAVLAGCQGDVTLDNVGDKISESVSDTITKTKEQVRSELKNAFVNEVQEFIANDDLAETLGISAEEQESINASIRGYIDNYELDEEELEAAKESVETFLENAKGLSVEEIKQNIADILSES